jgi:hypothetical protein
MRDGGIYGLEYFIEKEIKSLDMTEEMTAKLEQREKKPEDKTIWEDNLDRNEYAPLQRKPILT